MSVAPGPGAFTPGPFAPPMPPISLQQRLLGVAQATAVLLFMPAVAMKLIPEMAWGPGDFVVAGVLLFGTGSITVLAFRYVRNMGRRVVLISCIAICLALVSIDAAGVPGGLVVNTAAVMNRLGT